jgi:hypothetical protein
VLLEEFIKKDTENKNRIFVRIKCDVCLDIFERQKRFLNTHTCSERCRNILQGRTLIVNCGYCNKLFDLPKSKKLQVNYCSRFCKDTAQIESNYRLKALRYYGEKCQRCGFDNILALEVHHKDEDRANNDINNLEVLCANCHRIEHLGD